MAKHTLKTWSAIFQTMKLGIKNFDVRKDDRNFQVGDILELQEYDPNTRTFTGDTIERFVTYKLDGNQFGIEDGYCVLSLSNTVK